jgi:type I restriction enzyme, S subunit
MSKTTSEWKSVKVGTLCARVTSGGTPSTKHEEYYGGQIPWLRTQEVDFKPITDTFVKITELGLANSSAKWIPANSVIVAMYGATAGRVAITKIPLTTNQACCNLIVDSTKADYRYLYYSLKLNSAELEGCAKGSAQTNLSAAIVKDFEIPGFPLPTQRRIADILSAYDDLIENNRRRIEILEETARTLYRKMFGGAGTNGTTGTAALSELADVVMGQSPESKTYNTEGDGLPFHQGVTGFGDRFPTNELWCMAGTRFAEAGDILFSVRAPVGRINVCQEKIVIGRGLSAMRSKKGYQSWLLYALKSYFSKEDMIGVGCIFASTTKKELLGVELTSPPDNEILAFEKVVKPIDEQISKLELQNRALAAARDLLLPRLMSGKLEVSAAGEVA